MSAIAATPKPLNVSSKIGAKTVAPTASRNAASGRAIASVRFCAIDEAIPPPTVAKQAPQMNAAAMSHHGSGSKRSTQRMNTR